MADIENVKKGLLCRKEADKRCMNPCEENGNCPYAKRIIGLDGEPYMPFVCDKEKLIEDALKVIEKQEERIAIMQEPVEKKWYPKSRMWECQGCGDVVRGIDKYCSHCGRKFLEEEGEQDG